MDKQHEASWETHDGNKSPPTALGESESVGGEQFGRSGGVGDSGGRNRGDNYDHSQDNEAEFRNSASRRAQVASLANVATCEIVNNSNHLRKCSPMVAHCGLPDAFYRNQPVENFPLALQEEFNHDQPDSLHQHIARKQKEEEEEDEKRATSLPIKRRKVNLIISDANNNDLDGDIDSSDGSEHNYGHEEEDDNFSTSSDSSDLHISGTLAAGIARTRHQRSTDNNTANHSGAATGIRRRNISNRTLGREEDTDRIDLIKATAVPAKLNWDEQQRHKKQKLKIMKADGSGSSGRDGGDVSSKLATTPSKSNSNSQIASAYFCRLSRDDFGAASCSPPVSSDKSSSHQSDIFKCNNNNSKEKHNDGSIFNKSLSCVKNILSLSKFKQPKEPLSNLTSELRRSNEIKLQDWREPSDVINQEPEDTSSGEDKSSDMTGIDKGDYKTFKSSERRQSRSRRNHSRESQRRLSQLSGYSKLDHHHYQTTIDNRHSTLQELKRIALLVLIIVISCLLLWQVYELLLESYNFLGVVKTPSILGEYTKYAVSTDAEPCAKVGSDLLKIGGSAVDAAVGTLLCMGVILPNSLGLGGGCLMTIYDAKTKEAVVIDGRETAPGYAEENMFANDSLAASRGPLSVGVPGELAAYWKAHQRFGKLPWAHLFNDSIKFAEEGHPMVAHLANALRNHNHAQYLRPQLSELFTRPEGGYYKEGEIFVQSALAASLKRIRDNGVDEFYGGQTGQNFIDDLKNQGGKMTLADLTKYEALTRSPLKVKLADDLVLHTQPPPGSGIVLSVILRVMHRLGYYKNLKPQASFEAAALYYHRLAESFKFAYGQRAGLEDKPDDPQRMEKLMDKLLSEQYINEIASKVDGKTHENDYYGGLEYFRDDHGTAHVSVVDAEGNAAAVSTSVNLYFGAGMYSASTGITYNDVMDDFVSPHLVNKFGLAPSKYNRIRPGRRPLSSMVPSVFTDAEGNVRLVAGGAGGTMITTGVAMVSLRNCFLGEDIKTSIDGPRIHHQFLPNKLYYEVNFPKDLIHSLHEIQNHTTEPIVGRSSIVMAIASERTSSNKTRITANSDYRKGGSVHGQ